MNTQKLASVVLGLALTLTLVRCGATRDDGTDAGPPKKDGGVPAADTGTGLDQPDTGIPATGSDAGAADVGVAPGIETTIPDINNTASANHAAILGKKVHFKGVATSKQWQVSSSGPSGARTSCLRGVFMADLNAATPDYNGVLVVSKTTATSGKCNEDSQLPTSINIGDEIDVTGFYDEYCGNGGTACKDKDQTGKDIRYPEITASFPGQIIVGTAKGLPANLPVTVTIGQVNSVNGAAVIGGCSPFTLGTDWFKYRAVYVKILNVHPSSFNPDATKECSTDSGSTGDFCNWRIAPAGSTTPSMRVSADVFFGGIAPACNHRPKTDVAYNSLSGIVYCNFGYSKLEPTRNADGDPALP